MEQFVEFLGNHYMLTTAWIVLFILLVTSWVTSATSPIKTINTHELTQLVNKNNGVVIDTRAVKDFNKGHITDAVHMPLDKITSNQFGKLESRKSDPIIVVCHAGISAKTAARMLHKSGFEQVSVLQGGMQTWQGANLPIVKK
jgi:rhodanese-related sulfurtransferase